MIWSFLQVNHAEVPEEPFMTPHALMKTLRADLLHWRESLPTHLRFQEEYLHSDCPNESLHSWQARQRSSLRIRTCLYNYPMCYLVSSRRKDAGFRLY